MDGNKNKIARIFDELKSRGFINQNRKLKSSKRIFGPFKAGIVHSILYNRNLEEEFCQMNDDELRFVLLHEEGHIIGERCFRPPLILILILALLPLFLMAFGNALLLVSFISYSLLFIIFSVKILKDPLSRDEYKSDEFAAIILKKNFNVDKPSVIVNNTFSAFDTIYENKAKLIKPSKLRRWYASVVRRIIFAFFMYHPSVEDRVRNIREKFD
jgi:Zn-dependent protease with chaperone function